MAKPTNKILSLLKGLLALTGIRLLDPVEVYYLPDTETFYPIISKSGCSSIKLMLIRKFIPDFEAVFPDIHQIDPSEMTDNKLRRLIFYRYPRYAKWTAGKKMEFVMREPVSRLYSCYLDVKKDKNTMYKFPSGLHWFFSFKPGMSLDSFLENVWRTSDRYSDKHFRSQSFFLDKRVQKSLSKLNLYTLPKYMEIQNSGASKSGSSAVHLNTNAESKNPEIKASIEKNSDFKKRYATDIQLYAAIKERE